MLDQLKFLKSLMFYLNWLLINLLMTEIHLWVLLCIVFLGLKMFDSEWIRGFFGGVSWKIMVNGLVFLRKLNSTWIQISKEYLTFRCLMSSLNAASSLVKKYTCETCWLLHESIWNYKVDDAQMFVLRPRFTLTKEEQSKLLLLGLSSK